MASMSRNLHELAERRSLAIHQAVTDRLRSDPNLVERAKARVASWLTSSSVAFVYAKTWQRWLELPLKELLERLTEDSEEARAMRQVSPFAGVIGPRERWAIWRQEKHSFDAEGSGG
jgi:hypothetical protein